MPAEAILRQWRIHNLCLGKTKISNNVKDLKLGGLVDQQTSGLCLLCEAKDDTELYSSSLIALGNHDNTCFQSCALLQLFA
jgi:hypothetical protein